MSNFGNNITIEKETNALGNFLPNGRLFSSKNLSGSFFRRLLSALSEEVRRVRLKIIDVITQHDINQTSELLEEWEKVVGIPDSCFTTDYSLEDRRKHVILKLRANGTQTEQDFIDLAAYLGYTITITHPENEDNAVFPLDFPWAFDNPRSLRFIVYINFPADIGKDIFALDFAWSFSAGETSFLECFFNKLKPAHVKFIYRYIL